jgi:hypothetical protein
MFFLVFLLDDRRIRILIQIRSSEAQKHMDPAEIHTEISSPRTLEIVPRNPNEIVRS